MAGVRFPDDALLVVGTIRPLGAARVDGGAPPPARDASLAQMVERKTLNLVVVGSIPTEGAYFCRIESLKLGLPSSDGRAQDF